MSDKIFSSDKFHILDGAMGTMLQKSGLKLGQIPETLSVTNADIIIDIHKQYVQSGSEIIYANTFGANLLKLKNSGFEAEEIIEKSIENAKIAANGKALVALDVGPLGELLAPNGTMKFDDAYEIFKQIVLCGKNADLIVFETFSDLYELKAALLAAKENSKLPVICSMSFESNGRTFTGTPIECFSEVASSLGADAIGINCGLGPYETLPLAKRLCEITKENLPIFVKPNAGLPRADGSGYDMTSDDFCAIIDLYADLGVSAIGGCCGTTPEFIKKISEKLRGKKPAKRVRSGENFVCSATRAVRISTGTVVGERINPTGKKRFQQALFENDFDYILSQAIEQANLGAEILDVNVGVPGIDEREMLAAVTENIQSVVDLPLQIYSSSAESLENALRHYNGKPIVNSVSGEEQSLETILPLCKKYGAAVIGLTLDEKGIPSSAEERLKIAKKIVDRALKIGIKKEDIFIDSLTMTIASNQNNALITLDALDLTKRELGVKTALGVSNISFGLPERSHLNATFLTLALGKGLDLAIVNPKSSEIMSTIFSFNVLTCKDENCATYISMFRDEEKSDENFKKTSKTQKISEQKNQQTLKDAVIFGLKGKSAEIARELLKTKQPMSIVDEELIPALDVVGGNFEAGKCFLPELLQAAQAAQSAFEIIKERMSQSGTQQNDKGKIVLATVKGDIHDIGKNIVKVVLENYGYHVIDLGRDVPSETIIETVKKTGAKLVGLSALMTTTLKSMEETIKALKSETPDCKIMVGGAVLTEDYAMKIGADFFAKDAKKSADIAKEFFKN